MRRALESLTVRGRAFVASGATALVCGVILRERDLTRMGLLVAALPLLAATFLLARPQRLTLRRSVAPAHLTAGETAQVEIEIGNGGGPTGPLMLEELLPSGWGGHRRFLVDGLGRSEHRRLHYSVTPRQRGRHQLGPMSVRRREPFGMVEARQGLDGTATLLALPPVVGLSPIRLGSGRFTTGDEQPRSYTIGTIADVVVRPYRRGDDLRRVHWRSTARTGELMVRNEEQLWQARATVVLDDRARAHRGAGEGSSLETAVAAAASAAVHLSGLGYQVRLLTHDGPTDTWQERGRPLDPYPILERLATVEPAHIDDLPDLPGHSDADVGIVVAVVGATSLEEREWWAALARRGAQCLALHLDVADWGQRATELGPGPEEAPGWLVAQGWRTAVVRRGTSLADAWRELDR